MEYYGVVYTTPLQHHGIKGQKWGIRRWQNPDGTLTEAGMVHYKKKLEKANTRINEQKMLRAKYYKKASEALNEKGKPSYKSRSARSKQSEHDWGTFWAEKKYDDLWVKIRDKYGVDTNSDVWNNATSKAIKKSEERGKKFFEKAVADTEAAQKAYGEYLTKLFLGSDEPTKKRSH